MRLSLRIQNSLIEIIKLLFIVLFVYAAVSKWLDFEHFKMQLSRSPYISIYAPWLAWCLPIVELIIAGLFLFYKSTKLAFYTSLFLMTLFTTYLYVVLHYSEDIPCIDQTGF
ncbi:MauE/DoxX family redox-associated membrane protein [Confluentibacter sediminis]|uniref:MauE/DoxX family redox-associated membrane protein n=1 Tax=Confluentibacter sediminis TaxID=2219045 RepID=UPI000DAF087B|nr:MauE/DoxX family redox-associated membrane protein [Confluentibacter sediminis]